MQPFFNCMRLDVELFQTNLIFEGLKDLQRFDDLMIQKI